MTEIEYLSTKENISTPENKNGSKLLDRISHALTKDEKYLFQQVLNQRRTDFTTLSKSMNEIITTQFESMKNKNEPQNEAVFQITNAGLSLVSPWFHRLFKMVKLLNDDDKDFKDIDAKIRAIFVLQYVLFCDENKEYNEHDLVFNRILTSCPFNVPLPKKLQLTEHEKQCAESMLDGVKQNWDKLKNTSRTGFQESFLQRSGNISQNDEKWTVIVDPLSFDMLLDSLPWAYKIIRYKWLKKPIYVEWR